MTTETGIFEASDSLIVDLTQEQVETLAKFMAGVPGLTVLPCDDPFKGVKGSLAFYTAGNEEKSVWLRWRFARAVESTETFGRDSNQEEAKKRLVECLTQDGWVPCDDPKTLQCGFAKHQPVGSQTGSKAVVFGISVIKRMPDDVRQMFQAWRKQRMG